MNPVLLIADHKWRDLPGMALLKLTLEREHGIPAEVISYFQALPAIRVLRPRGLVLTTVISAREQGLASAVRAIGGKVAVIPTEGIPGSTQDMGAMLRSPDVWRFCDRYLTWGSGMAEFALERGYMTPEQVQITGNARFDFYQPPFRSLLLSSEDMRARYGLRPAAPIVTWATTFIIASYLDDEERLRFNEEDFKRRGLDKIPGYANLRDIGEQELVARELTFAWAQEVARRHSEAEFLMKPHPYEPVEPYEVMLEEAEAAGIMNLKLITTEFVHDLLNSAALHIHSGSTTGLEAWLMGVPSINLRPGGYARFAGATGGALPRLDDLDDCRDDLEGLSTAIRGYLTGGRLDAETAAARAVFLKDWFHEPDGRGALRQAEAIAELVDGADPTAPLPRAGWYIRYKELQYRLNRLLGRAFDAQFVPGRRGHSPHIGLRDREVFQQDVRVWIDRLRRVGR